MASNEAAAASAGWQSEKRVFCRAEIKSEKVAHASAFICHGGGQTESPGCDHLDRAAE